MVQPSQNWRKMWKWFCFGTSRSCIWVLFSFGRSCIWVDALIRVIKGSTGADGANIHSQWMQTKYIWHMMLTIYQYTWCMKYMLHRTSIRRLGAWLHPSYIAMYESHTVIYFSNTHQFRDGAECPHFLSHAQSLEINR